MSFFGSYFKVASSDRGEGAAEDDIPNINEFSKSLLAAFFGILSISKSDIITIKIYIVYCLLVAIAKCLDPKLMGKARGNIPCV